MVLGARYVILGPSALKPRPKTSDQANDQIVELISDNQTQWSIESRQSNYSFIDGILVGKTNR